MCHSALSSRPPSPREPLPQQSCRPSLPGRVWGLDSVLLIPNNHLFLKGAFRLEVNVTLQCMKGRHQIAGLSRNQRLRDSRGGGRAKAWWPSLPPPPWFYTLRPLVGYGGAERQHRRDIASAGKTRAAISERRKQAAAGRLSA